MTGGLRVLSLFSGVGGFDLGLERAGYQTVFQCEIDKYATKVLERHWPGVPRWGDITTLTGRHIVDTVGAVDVVAWGSPCQDLSIAGKRTLGLRGDRSGLFHQGVRIIKEIKEATGGRYPRISLWENVLGALNSNGGADFGCVINEMAEAGALVIEWRVLDAQYFGVPQRRRRVFVVAVFDSSTAERCSDPLLAFTESVRGHLTESEEPREGTAAEPRGRLANGSEIANTIPASLYHKQTVVNQDVNNGHLIVGSLAARDYKGVSSQFVREGKVVVQGAVYGVQGNVIGRQDHNGPAGKGHTEEGEPMFTLTSTDIHAVAHHHEALDGAVVRRLTPIECERLMGWPDDWTGGQGDAHRYRQCGNGVASPVATWLGEQLRKVLVEE